MQGHKQIIPARESEHYTASQLREVIGELGFALSFPRGVSMRPLIWQGEHYVVICKLEGEPRVGDILVFEQIRREKTAYIVHRLVKVEENGGEPVYVTRGDNCLGCERFRREDIIGVVTEVFRNGAWKPWHAVPKKHFTVSDRGYGVYSVLWMNTFPLRKGWYRLRGLLSKIKHRLT